MVREGYVVRNLHGSTKSDGQANCVIRRICRRAQLPAKRWHTLRHTFGTHAALFGVNPWRRRTIGAKFRRWSAKPGSANQIPIAASSRCSALVANLAKTEVAGSEKAVGVAS